VDTSRRASATQPVRRRTPDLTTGPVGRTLIAFALPVLGANILQTLNASVNTAWVSHLLGEAALTATANSGQIFFLMIGVVFGISIIANVMVAQAVGAGDEAAAGRVVGTCAVFFIAASVTAAVAGVIFAPAILDFMSTPADARAGAIIYLRVLFAALPSVYFFNFVMAAQRGVGDSRTPFYFALFQVGLDVLLNPLLILGLGPLPRLGIAGSAAASLVSQSIALGLMLLHLYRRRSILVIRPSQWRLLIPRPSILKALILKGLPMGAQMIVMSVAGVAMMRLVNGYGSHTGAAYGAAMQLWSYVQMPAMALGAAVSSMAAQNVGARRMDRVERVAWVGAGCAVMFSLGPILLLLAIERFLLLAFLPAGSPSIAIAQHINLIALWGFIPFGVAFCFSGVIRATGVVWPPLIAMIVALWFVRVPFAELMQPYWGADAVWASFPVGSLSLLAFAMAYYRFGGWRKAQLVHVVAHGETPDPGQGPSIGIEETEAQAEALEALRGGTSLLHGAKELPIGTPRAGPAK
jgi:putative MATE family efflux protein